jgi:8-oxo-dGTP diphosphatase
MGSQEQGADQTNGRWITIPRSLCFIRHGDDVLLMKRGEHKRIFPGRYNGIGGHIERDEDPLTSALREIHEETQLTVSDVRLRGITNVDAGSASGIMLFVFTAVAQSRDFIDCSEGTLHWIALNAIHDLSLVEDVPLLLPRLFGEGSSDALFFAHVSYDAQDRMIMKFNDRS